MNRLRAATLPVVLVMFNMPSGRGEAQRSAPNQPAPQRATVRVRHPHQSGGCEGYLTFDRGDIKYEDVIDSGKVSHKFSCHGSQVINANFIDNTDLHDHTRGAQLWVDVKCKSFPSDMALVFYPAASAGAGGVVAPARDSFVLAQKVFETYGKRP